ncbi:hypothetical protein BsWGS_05273 [Bradybaena similaris]
MDYLRADGISDKCTDEDISEGYSEPQGSILWSKRSLVYRCSFLALAPLFAVFLLGFSSPFWMKKHQVDKYRGYYNIREKVDVSIGIWRVCEGSDFSDITDCTVIPDLTNYIVLCQSMLCLCLIFIVLSLIFGIYENCATRYDIDEGSEVRTKRPEMNAVIAGLFGLTGISMYGTSIIDAMRNGEGEVHWAFLVTAGSVLGVIICGIIMAIVNPIHSTVETFPGQVINLSRQNSLKGRQPTIQDRLVTSGECVIQINGTQASGTTYGVTDSNFDLKEVSLLNRSGSSLASDVSTPDGMLTTSHDLDLSNSNKSLHVVDTRDIHARVHDLSQKVDLMQQKRTAKGQPLQCEAGMEPDNVNDLFDVTFDDILTSDASSYSDNENFKLLESPRRDKNASLFNSDSRTLAQSLKLRNTEPADLMVLDEFLVKPTAKDNVPGAMAERALLQKRTFNPFLEEGAVSLPNVNELQRSTVSNSSWESQPWPDPPLDNEILDQPLLNVPTNRSSTPDAPSSKSSDPQFKTSAERLQCQPQSQTVQYKKLTQDQISNVNSSTPKSVASKPNSSKTNQIKPNKKTDKKSVSPNKTQAAARKDYDNPLFESQILDGDKSDNTEKSVSIQESQSSALVRPSAEKSSIPCYTATDPIQAKSESSNNSTIVDTKRQTTENSEGRQSESNRTPASESNKVSSPMANRFGKKGKEDSRSSLLNESPGPNKDQRHLVNGLVKSSSKQFKDEPKQKPSGQVSSGQPQKQQPPSKKPGPTDSPQIGSKLPRPSSDKKNVPESKDVSVRNRDEPAKTEKHKRHESKSSKQHSKK